MPRASSMRLTLYAVWTAPHGVRAGTNHCTYPARASRVCPRGVTQPTSSFVERVRAERVLASETMKPDAPATLPKHRLISSGSRFESEIGFSRAVRVAGMISVSATAAIAPDGSTVGIGDAAAQARRCLDIIRDALERADASFADVIRTRVLLVRIEDWQAVSKVHGEIFGEIRPATTVMQVVRFIDPDWLVEIEADAVVG
jgi:enamine deaminase RidA (YjgF/YER057c/UK114 family)